MSGYQHEIRHRAPQRPHCRLNQGLDLEQFDPATSVAVPGRRRLLFQHGRHDPVVRQAESLKLYEAAAHPKDWREYNCGHDPDGDPQAVTDRAELFSARPAN